MRTIYVLTALALPVFMGCSSGPPTEEELASADYGAPNLSGGRRAIS